MKTCFVCGGRGFWNLLDYKGGVDQRFDCDDCGRTGQMTDEQEKAARVKAGRLKQKMLDTVKNWMRRN